MRFRGRLFDFGDYPGAVLAATGRPIRAELYRILQPAILKTLDDFEVYRPAEPRPFDRRTGRGSLFVRLTVLAGGVRAYVYLWNGSTAGAHKTASH